MLLYILKEYALLFLFISSILGIGNLLLNCHSSVSKIKEYQISKIFYFLIKFATGLSILVLFTQILLITGFFSKKLFLLFFFTGLISFLYYSYKNHINTKIKQYVILNTIVEYSKKFPLLSLLVFISTIAIILKPLRPPLAWDEVAYHMPHAKYWAESAVLTINSNIRYPWFPYNFDILYSIPLLFDNDVFPKLIHGATGITIGLIGFILARKNTAIGLLTLCFWLFLSRGMYEKAYVELGLAFFTSMAAISIFFWSKKNNPDALLYLGSLFFGVALGIKYQSLMYSLPIFFLFAMNYKKTDIKSIFTSFLFLMTPCVYWYLRNYIYTGNPINPVAGNLFGHFDWNQIDYDFQFYKLGTKREIATPILLVSFLFIFFKNKYSDLSHLYYFLCLSFLIWFISSGYWRYLYSIFPIMCFFLSVVIYEVFEKFKKKLFSNKNIKIICITMMSFLIFIYFIDSILRLQRSLNYIPYEENVRQDILKDKIRGYEAIKFINDNNLGPTYQFRMEDSIYYFKHHVMGDTFGYGRYIDFFGLNAKDLKEKLKKYKINTVILGEWVDFDQRYFTRSPDLSEHFEEIYNKNNYVIYKVIY